MDIGKKTYAQLLREGEALLQGEAVADAALDAFLLLEYVTGMNRSSYYLRCMDTADGREEERYRKLLRKRAAHVPLQHLTGEQEFMGLPFVVNENVLIPRQDTECLVETALPYVEGKRVLDMCTGSGCIAISLKVLGKAAYCDAVDFSAQALEVAEQNARRNHAQIHFIRGDLFEGVTGVYDVIVSNPPYISPDVIQGLSEEVRCHEPYMALNGGVDGLSFYRRITAECMPYLAENGLLLYETGYDQAAAVMSLLRNAGFAEICCKKDYAGKDRVVYGRKAGGKTCLTD